MQELWDGVKALLGVGVESPNSLQMAARALLLYIAALVMVRLGDKRFLGKNTAFDVILGIILGSVVSRAINGKADLFPTVVAGFVLVGLHWLLAKLSLHSRPFEKLVKGEAHLLVEDGVVRQDRMSKSAISRSDLEDGLRSQARVESVEEVAKVYLERSGNISVIGSRREPKVLEVKVADGVQTVRIQLE